MLTDGRTDGRRTDGRRTTDAGVTGILIAHLGAFGSGELKIIKACPQKRKVRLNDRLNMTVVVDCNDWDVKIQTNNKNCTAFQSVPAEQTKEQMKTRLIRQTPLSPKWWYNEFTYFSVVTFFYLSHPDNFNNKYVLFH